MTHVINDLLHRFPWLWTILIICNKKNYQNVVSFQPMRAPELRSDAVKIQGIECH